MRRCAEDLGWALRWHTWVGLVLGAISPMPSLRHRGGHRIKLRLKAIHRLNNSSGCYTIDAWYSVGWVCVGGGRVPDRQASSDRNPSSPLLLLVAFLGNMLVDSVISVDSVIKLLRP